MIVKKIQIFIDHDIMIRHFLLSDTFSSLSKNYEIQYVFPVSARRIKTSIDSLKLKNYKIITVDNAKIGKLKNLAKIQTMHIARKNKSFKFVIRQWKLFFCWKDFYKMWLKSLPVIFNFFKNKIIKENMDLPEIEKVIDDFKPDIIIHPSVLDGVFISGLTYYSKIKNIPFLVLMNSWDNPSTKAFVINPPDYLCVWGEQTKEHAVKFLGINEKNVIILGPAQFEVYRKKVTKNHEQICKELNIDPKKRLILYAGSSKSINEMNHLLYLEKIIQEDKLPDCHVIFRPHPWRAPADDEPDFYDLNLKHVSMDLSMKDFYNSPKQKDKKKKDKINLTDYMDTHNILSAIDLLISNVSTILLEAALHGKPIVCMVSDTDIKNSVHLRATMNSLYFQDLFKYLDVPRCREYHDLLNISNDLLNRFFNNPKLEMAQKEKTKYFVDMGHESYPVKLKKLVDNIINN